MERETLEVPYGYNYLKGDEELKLDFSHQV